jgi:hypothetical protein
MKSGNEEQIRGAKAMMALQTRMQTFGSDLGQGVRDLSAGVSNTDAASALVQSTGGAALDIMSRLKAGAIDQDQAQIELISSMERNQEAQLQIASTVGDAPGVYSKLSGVMDAINAKNAGSFEKAKTAQDAQTSGADALTNTTVKAQKSMEGLNIEIQKLGFTFLPKAAIAVASMTGAMEKFVKYVNKTIGAALDEESATKAGAASSASPSTADMINQGYYSDEDDAALRASPAYKAEQAKLGSTAAGAPAGGSRSASAAKPTSQSELRAMGLKIKEGDVQAEGSGVDPKLIELAKKIQETVPGFSYFSGFNDKYHQGKDNPSKHKEGLALDFALSNVPTLEEGSQLASMIKGLGASYVKDEYNGSSKNKTAGHFHAEVSAARGAILSGPVSGYKPNLTMHGTEAVVPLNKTPSNLEMPGLGSLDPGVMMAQLEKMDEMISVLKSQLGVSEKLLRYQS